MDRNHHPPAQDDHTHHLHSHCRGKVAGPSSTIVHMQARRKAMRTQSWLIISQARELRAKDMEEHSVMQRTGLPARELKVLFPILSYPSS
ncbi:hypothetical protein MLD38_026102 [Melastoma candidum]|uniref:Uncharacterized protein n=1 Tax=Melastoma candidum TaxID=119954 RepID=A0ACB9P2N4_9MYRT|nr:hypothetical protein MLD38_026102 [Melastoma candidum]